MTPEQFVAKWTLVDLPERAASQEHFLDLCHLLGQPTPAADDPTGESYCFEKAVKVVGAASKGSRGDSGFVDVWKKGAFGWEYKRKDKYASHERPTWLKHAHEALDRAASPPMPRPIPPAAGWRSGRRSGPKPGPANGSRPATRSPPGGRRWTRRSWRTSCG